MQIREQWKEVENSWLQKIRIVNNSLRYSYHYKMKTGDECFVFEINTPQVKQLCGYVLIEKDLRDTIDFTDELIRILLDDPVNKILVKALTRAIVITYGKCFASTTGRKTQLGTKEVPHDLKNYHEELINMRNEYVAHAGTSAHEYCKSVYLIPPEKKYRKGQAVSSASFVELYQTNYSLNTTEWLPLLESIHGIVQEKIIVLKNRFLPTPPSPEKVYALIKTRKKLNTKRIILNENDVKLLFEPTD